LYRVSRWCSRHGWLVVGLWLLTILLTNGLNRGIPGVANQTFVLPGANSYQAQTLLNEAFPSTAVQASPIVLNNPDVDFSSGEGAATVKAVIATAMANPAVTAVADPATTPSLISSDKHTVHMPVSVQSKFASDSTVATQLLADAQASAPADDVQLGGLLGQSISKPDTHLSDVLGLMAAVVVLLVTFRRFSAAAIPLVNAVVAVAVGLALIGLLGKVVSIPTVAPTLGTMLGLGVGIDYALFLVTRHRTLIAEGYDISESVARTCGTAGAAIVFAGATLLAAMLGLTFTGLSFLAWLGVAASLVVAVAIAAALTLVPALLGIMGRRVMPRRELPHHDGESLDNSRWGRLAGAVTSRPWLFTVVAGGVLLTLAAPLLSLQVGYSDASNLPQETTAYQANALVTDAFGPGSTSPLVVVSEMLTIAAPPPEGATSGGDPRAQDPRLTQLHDALVATSGVAEVGAPIVSTDGGVATIEVTPDYDGADPRTSALVINLRDSVLPPVDDGAGMRSFVGGVTALNLDLTALIAQRTPYFILGVVLLAFVLLMIAYRSVVIPLQAAVMNLLSIAAAMGVVTAVFQFGWGAPLIGLEGPVPINSFVPMMIFAVLFGLSMDYEVFLLTGIKEQWDRTGDMRVSVRRGLADTGHIVTAAALIMIVVFSSFILNSDSTVKIFGVGLATAVAVDATIVRCLLVPAVMVLCARATWWVPGWLDRLLPHLNVEGDPAAMEALASRAPTIRVETSHSGAARVAIGAVVGTIAGFVPLWLIDDRRSAVAIAVSAVMGAALVALPASTTSGRSSVGRRLFGFIAGAIVSLLVASVVTSLVIPANSSETLSAAVSILVVALLILPLVGRSLALPVLLGSVVVSLVILTGQDAFGGGFIVVALLPALVSALVTGAIAGNRDAAAAGPQRVPEPGYASTMAAPVSGSAQLDDELVR